MSSESGSTRARTLIPLALVVVAVLAAVSGPAASTADAKGKPTPRPTPTSTPVPTPTPPPSGPAPISIYGTWHCSDDFCTWGHLRTFPEFDQMNHWIVDRDGSGPSTAPSVNLVVLAFVNPLVLQTNVSVTDGVVVGNPLAGIPVGMTQEIVDYFTGHGIRVMLSIGGITYTDAWNTALAQGGRDLGLKAAAVANALGVGIEIDYEENTSANLVELEQFIRGYRSVLPFDPANTATQRRLTIDTAAGARWLIDINRKATTDWLRSADHTPAQDPEIALDWANAMVPARQPSASTAIANWQEHVDGKAQYAPPVPPLAPAKFMGGIYLAEGSQVRPECTNFAASLQSATQTYVRTVAPKGAGTTQGMLGWMFWAAEEPSTRGVGTQPPNTCEGGMGVGASTFAIPIPMLALRQQ